MAITIIEDECELKTILDVAQEETHFDPTFKHEPKAMMPKFFYKIFLRFSC